MRIAYAARFDPLDVRRWSGISFHMIKALEAAGAEVEVIGPLVTRRERASRARRRLARAFGKVLDITREPSVVDGFGRQVDAALRHSTADLVLSPDVPTLAGARDPRPKAVWTGSSLPVLVDYYADYTAMTKRSLRFGRQQEQALLARCASVVYASDWVRQTTVADYDLDPSRVTVVPFGANMVGPADLEAATRMVQERASDHCNLLFLGVDWARKRGDLAVAVVERARAQGVDARLTVIGCIPPESVVERPWVRAIGYLDKTTPAGRSRLAQELAAAHFLIHPTTAETFGIALCEAAAFALPVLASRTGGIPSIVDDGVTGALLSPDATAEDFARCLEAMSCRDVYLKMTAAAFERWGSDLNWSVSGKRALSIFSSALV